MKSTSLWVLDTNVLVSGLISAKGPPGRLIDAFLARRLQIAFDDRILQEYKAVLARPKFQFKPADVTAFWEILPFQCHLVAMPVECLQASDPDDTKFLEVATATESKTLVTGNKRYYPEKSRGDVVILTPAEAFDCIA
jgi:putative PIN family toxin of toxin-antitoxin system